MTIDEAIKHCLEVAEQNETASTWQGTIGKLKENCRQCAADHRQLAEWLTELKELREEYADMSKISKEFWNDLQEAKRLLGKAMQTLNDGSCNKACRFCKWLDNCEMSCRFAWRYGDEALKLIGDDEE